MTIFIRVFCSRPLLLSNPHSRVRYLKIYGYYIGFHGLYFYSTQVTDHNFGQVYKYLLYTQYSYVLFRINHSHPSHSSYHDKNHIYPPTRTLRPLLICIRPCLVIQVVFGSIPKVRCQNASKMKQFTDSTLFNSLHFYSMLFTFSLVHT